MIQMIIGVNKNLLNALFTQKHYFNRHLLTQGTKALPLCLSYFRQQQTHSLSTASTYVFEMFSLQELQRIDRELSLELIESPINPAFLHMSTPLKSEYNPLFYLQINGEALWQRRKFY